MGHRERKHPPPPKIARAARSAADAFRGRGPLTLGAEGRGERGDVGIGFDARDERNLMGDLGPRHPSSVQWSLSVPRSNYSPTSLSEEIIELAQLNAEDRALDIGAGTGLLALASAPIIQHVTALDVSPAMCRHLEAKLLGLPLANVDVVIGTAIDLPVAAGSVRPLPHGGGIATTRQTS